MSDEADKIVAAILTHGRLAGKHELSVGEWASEYEAWLEKVKTADRRPRHDLAEQLEQAETPVASVDPYRS